MTDPSASTRSRSTRAPDPTRPRARGRCRSTSRPPIVFRDADHAAALFNLQEVGYIYSRLTNPTVAALQERIATLEGGVGAVCCSSGHAAQIMALFPLMAPGRNIVASTRFYGGTIQQFTNTIRKFGWSAKFVDIDDLEGDRGRHRRQHPRDLLRDDLQPRRLRSPTCPPCARVADRPASR